MPSLTQNILYFYRQLIDTICILLDYLFSYCIKNPFHLLLIAIVLLFIPILLNPAIATDFKEHFIGVDRFTEVRIKKKYKNADDDQKIK